MVVNNTVTVHGTLGSKAILNDPKSRKTKFYGLGFPVGSRLQGGFFQKRSGIDLVIGNLRQLLQTEKGERVYLPNYGCNLRRFLFQPLDEITFNEMKLEILNSISKYSKGTSVRRIRIFPSGENSINVSLTIQVKELEGAIAEVEVTI